MAENEEENDKFRVSVTISALGNERRTIPLGERTQEEIQSIIRVIDAAFATVRASHALTLTDSNGVVVFANLDNVAFVEVHVVPT
jgi:hypothetical protein